MSAETLVHHRLNAICPYFTMFPLRFPLDSLRGAAKPGDVVLDPFCGRGTTNYAARLLGLDSVGIDSSPVAVAITAAKLVDVSPEEVVAEARSITNDGLTPEAPSGEFWEWAFHRSNLQVVSKLREALLEDCTTPERIALRGVVMGALHGPLTKGAPSYLSNQSPRTYAPKPAYAVRFWRGRGMRPPEIDVMGVLERRAQRYYGSRLAASGTVLLADSRSAETFEDVEQRFRWIVTSPPYYGMRTYIPDQWLRSWFVGGPSTVDYRADHQVSHQSPTAFANDLRKVWRNVASVAKDGATLIVRFGGISDRDVDPNDLVLRSLEDTNWKVKNMEDAGTAGAGRRQADTFLRTRSRARGEIDVRAVLG